MGDLAGKRVQRERGLEGRYLSGAYRDQVMLAAIVQVARPFARGHKAVVALQGAAGRGGLQQTGAHRGSEVALRPQLVLQFHMALVRQHALARQPRQEGFLPHAAKVPGRTVGLTRLADRSSTIGHGSP